MAVFNRPARQLPTGAFLPATLSLARRAGQWQAGRSRSGPARRTAGGEAGGRYREKNSTGSWRGQICELKPGSLGLAHLTPTYLTTSLDPYRWRLEKIGMTG